MNYLTVDLYSEFQCIADACPDTCCVGWGIIIDEQTYEKMKEHEETLGIPADDWIMKTGEYRSVKLDHLRCPMLDKDNLCKVVSRLGPECLSVTCTSYPRVLVQYGSVIEGHLTLSCPEAVARLMDKEEVQFDFTEDDTPSEEDYSHEQLYLYEAAVRGSMVDIFQYPARISLVTRTAVAFDMLEKAIRLYQDGIYDYGMLKGEIDWYFREDRLYQMDQSLQVLVNEHSRYHFRQQICSLLREEDRREHFAEIAGRADRYFARNDAEQYVKDIQKFMNYQMKYEDFYIRYWMYRIFSDVLSVPDFEKSRGNFMCIAAAFCLTQTIALATYAENGVLEREEYIYIISRVSRMIEHSKQFRKNLMERLEENHVNSLAGLLLMV